MVANNWEVIAMPLEDGVTGQLPVSAHHCLSFKC